MRTLANHRFSQLCVFILVAGLLSLGKAAAADRGVGPASRILGHKEGVIVVGRVSEDPKKHFPRLEKMANYLAGRLAPLGISTGAAVVVRSNEEMIEALRHGAVDLISETVFSAVRISQESGAEIMLREWKGGKAEYRTVMFARKDSPIESLADLKGKSIAFEDRGSTSGFLLPLAILRQKAFQVVELGFPRDKPPADKIGYAFAMGEVNIMAWVVEGLADAGALSNLDWEDLARTPRPLKKNVRIFHATPPIIRSLLIARKGLDGKLKARVQEVLLTMHADPEGREVLKAYDRVARYDRIEGEAARSLDEVRRLIPLIREDLR